MPRKPRPDLPGSLHHVILRGNNRQDVFTSSNSRLAFLEHVSEAVDRLACRVHAFCLMTNHIHVAIQQGNVPLSRIVQFLAQRHSVETNRSRGMTGHLFQGRFWSVPVETDGQALELVRYIHLNPVRAGIVSAPDEWRWSSHRAYVGLASLSFLTTDWVLGMLGTPVDARDRFREFVVAGLADDEGARSGLKDAAAPEMPPASSVSPEGPGSGDFVQSAIRSRENQAPRTVPLDRVVAAVLEVTHLTEADLVSSLRPRRLSHARALIGWLSLQAPSVTLTEVAHRFRRDVSTLSKSVARLDGELKRDPSLEAWLEKLLEQVRRSTYPLGSTSGPNSTTPESPTSQA